MIHGSNPWGILVTGLLPGGIWAAAGWTHRTQSGYPLLWAATPVTTALTSALVPLSTCSPRRNISSTASDHLFPQPTQSLRSRRHLLSQVPQSFLCPHPPAPPHGATPVEPLVTVQTAKRRRASAKGARVPGGGACTAATSQVVVKFTAKLRTWRPTCAGTPGRGRLSATGFSAGNALRALTSSSGTCAHTPGRSDSSAPSATNDSCALTISASTQGHTARRMAGSRGSRRAPATRTIAAARALDWDCRAPRDRERCNNPQSWTRWIHTWVVCFTACRGL